MEHSGLALVPNGLQRQQVSLERWHWVAPALPPPCHCPAWRSPRLGGSGWAASVPTGRTAPRAWSPWGTGARAASGSPGHAPAESDTGGPRGRASRVSSQPGQGSLEQCDLNPCQQNLCSRHLLPLLLAQHPEFPFRNLPSPPHGTSMGTRLSPGLLEHSTALATATGQRQAHDTS